MLIETQPIFSQFLRANLTIAYRRPIILILNVFGLFYVIMPFLFPVFCKDEIFGYIQLFFVVFLLLLPTMIYFRVRKGFTSTSLYSEKRTYEFTSDKIIIVAESCRSEILWSKIYKVNELNRWVLIYTTPYLVYIIPKEAFADKLEQFRQLVKSQPVKQKLR